MNKTITTALMATLVSYSSLGLADGFNPAKFVSDQIASMHTEQLMYDTIANKSINDLNAFLKKNGLNDNSKNKESPAFQSSAAPSSLIEEQKNYQAAPKAPADYQHQPIIDTNKSSKSISDNLPLNTNKNSNEKTHWKYKL